ncbi:hypothetical protein KIN20_020560 [Parelaphostrongylus tenuis]|uniref:Bromodomain protein 4 C-terminal domain-containing protein n=1 Tax=Parelaphostrongylus tenuis TaxID=148309 RepID=A0AAD5QTU5_PARTN|nr:hypothetical protein KIN20_020560 [Parelaphostrongylus tenuis]
MRMLPICDCRASDGTTSRAYQSVEERKARRDRRRSRIIDDRRKENVHFEKYHDSHRNAHGEQRDQRDDNPNRQQPLESGDSQQHIATDGCAPHVLTQEGAMLLRKEQQRRRRELAKDVDLTSQIELMLNFEASL